MHPEARSALERIGQSFELFGQGTRGLAEQLTQFPRKMSLIGVTELSGERRQIRVLFRQTTERELCPHHSCKALGRHADPSVEQARQIAWAHPRVLAEFADVERTRGF